MKAAMIETARHIVRELSALERDGAVPDAIKFDTVETVLREMACGSDLVSELLATNLESSRKMVQELVNSNNSPKPPVANSLGVIDPPPVPVKRVSL